MNAVPDVSADLPSAVPDQARRGALLAALKAALPAHCVLHQPEDTRPYECDGLAMIRVMPLAVVLPETEDRKSTRLNSSH